jgi:hypothetical protein
MDKKKIKSFIEINIGVLAISIGYYFFLLPTNLVTGGIMGLSILIKDFIPFPPSIFLYICAIILLILSGITLGKNVFLKSVYGALLEPTFIFIFEHIVPSDYLINTLENPSNALFVATVFSVIIYAGGICGTAKNSAISKCCVDFKTSTNINLESQTQNGKIYYGGLVGESYNSLISNSYMWQENSKIETTISGKYGLSYVGGLVGYLGYTSSINNSYALLVSIKCYDTRSSTSYDGDMYLGGLAGKVYSNSAINNSFLTTYKDGSSRSLNLFCEDYKGFIVGNTNNTSLITNNYVDSEIYFVGGTSSFGDSDYITTDTLKTIKTLLRWDTKIWNLNFYGENIAPILK